MSEYDQITPKANAARICNVCGNELKSEQIFCSNCGKKYEAPYFTCQSCGHKILQGENFCSHCGAKYLPPCPKCSKCGYELSYEDSYCGSCGALTDFGKKHLKKKNTSTVLELLKRIIPVLISLFIVVSCFLPIVKIKFPKDDIGLNKDLRISHSPLDLVILSSASFIPIDTDEHKERSKELLEEFDFLENSNKDDLSGKDVSKIDSIAKKILINETQYNAYDPFCISLLFLGLICITYMFLSIVLLTFSVIDLIRYFIKRSPKLSDRSFISILTFFPAISLTILTAYRFSTLQLQWYTIEMKKVLCCTSPLILFIGTIAVLVFFAISKIFFEKSYKLRVSNIIKRLLSSTFIIALLFFTMSPIFATTLNAKFLGSSKAKESTAFLSGESLEALNAGTDDLEKYGKFSKTKEFIDSQIVFIEEYFSAKDFKKTNYVSHSLLRDVSLGILKNRVPIFYSFAASTIVLLSLFAALILCSNIATLTTGEHKKTLAIPILKIAILILALFILITAIALAISATSCAKKLGIDYRVSVAYGVIIMSILSCAIVATPLFKSQKIDSIPLEPLNTYV